MGFLLDFEYIIGLPKKIDQIEFIYGVYARGEALISGKKVDAHDCISESAYSSKCLINEKEIIYDIPSKFDTLLIIEIQVHSNLGYTREEKIETLGWTMIDLFDLQKNLR